MTETLQELIEDLHMHLLSAQLEVHQLEEIASNSKSMAESEIATSIAILVNIAEELYGNG